MAARLITTRSIAPRSPGRSQFGAAPEAWRNPAWMVLHVVAVSRFDRVQVSDVAEDIAHLLCRARRNRKPTVELRGVPVHLGQRQELQCQESRCLLCVLTPEEDRHW